MAEYIDGRFKSIFIIRFLLGMVMIAFFSCLLFYAIIPNETASHYISLMSSFRDVQENLLTTMLVVGIFEIILALLFTLLLGLFVAHKIGGPVYKLQNSIEQLQAGNLNLAEINFRTRDQGQILARRFNEMLLSWRLHLSEMKYNYCKLAARINILEKNGYLGDNAANDRLIKRMQHDLEKVQGVLDRFVV